MPKEVAAQATVSYDTLHLVSKQREMDATHIQGKSFLSS